MDDRFRFITVRKETKLQLRRMCLDGGFTYDFLIRQMIKKYQGDEE